VERDEGRPAWGSGTRRLGAPSGEAVRIGYYVATGRRIILLTVFSKQRQREVAEVKRARRAMERCISEGHTLEDADE
jgi:hypothetical protein